MSEIIGINVVTIGSPSSRLDAIPATGDLLLIELGRQLKQGCDLLEKLDLDEYALLQSVSCNTPESEAEEKRLASARTRLLHQGDAIRNLAPFIPASTLGAAAVQLAMARTLVWEIESEDLSGAESVDIATRLKLIIESALAVIAPIADMPFDVTGGF